MGDAAGYPSEGWVVWTFLISLGKNGFFSILLEVMLSRPARSITGPTVTQAGPEER